MDVSRFVSFGGPLQNVLQTCTSKTLSHSTVELRSVLPFCMAWQLDMAVVIIYNNGILTILHFLRGASG